MTVKDLVTQLQSLPEDLEVALSVPYDARPGEFVGISGAFKGNTSDMNWDGDPDYPKDFTLIVIE